MLRFLVEEFTDNKLVEVALFAKFGAHVQISLLFPCFDNSDAKFAIWISQRSKLMIWGTDLERFGDLLYLYVSIFETYIFFFLFFYRPLFAILFQSDRFVNNSKFALPHL